jgi:hypothetical protein
MNDKKKSEGKLTLKREKIVVLNARTGVKTGGFSVPPTWLCSVSKTLVTCHHIP